MDINNIQALIAQGLITDVASVDPNKAYVAVGVYQPGNRPAGSGDNTYPSYAIPVSEFLSGVAYTASNGISLVGNDFQFTSQNVSQFINDANYIAGTGSIGFVPRWDLTNVLGNSIIFDDGLGKVGIANTSPSETLDVTGTLKVSAGTHILRGLVGSPAISALYMGVVPGATNYILAYNGGNSYINGTTVNVAIAGSVKELTTATYSEILQNLGIGIVPTEALHVNGNALLSNQTYRYKIGNYDALGITQGVGSPNIIVGHGNTMNDASNGGGIVIGFGATSSSDGISIGLSAVVSGASEDGIAIGRSATVAVGVIRGAAFGRDALSSADNAFAIGNYVVANTPDTIIFGTNTAGNKQKVGIGTTNPDATLHIKGDANAGTYAVKVDNLAGNPLLYVRNDGNVGVGTATPTSKLDVNGQVVAGLGGGIVTSNNSPFYAVRLNTGNPNYYSGFQYVFEVGGGVWGIGMSYVNNEFQFLTNGASTAKFVYGDGNSASPNSKFVMDLNGGFFGANIASPTATIHAKGINATSSNYALKVDNSNGAAGPLLYVRNDGVSTFNTASTYATNFGYDVKWQVFSNPASSDGNYISLCTGGGTLFNTTFSRRNAGVVKTEMYFIESNDTTYMAIGVIGDANKGFALRTNDLDRVFITHAGDVCIGGYTPTTKLQVIGLPTYADNASALVAGLTNGAMYIRTGHGLDIVI